MIKHNGYTSIHYGPMVMQPCVYLFEGSRKLSNPRAFWLGRRSISTFKRNQ